MSTEAQIHINGSFSTLNYNSKHLLARTIRRNVLIIITSYSSIRLGGGLYSSRCILDYYVIKIGCHLGEYGR